MKNLIIPVEIKHRELQGALILSYFALKMGWTVSLGQKSQIFPFIKYFSKSIWFLKSIVPGELSNLKKIKSFGHKLTTLDVEGLILSNGKFGVIKRYSKESINLVDKIFFWGKKSHYEPVYKIFPEIKNKGYITGSPIIDGWYFEKLNFKKKYNNKKTILVSVNFARADPKFKNARKVYEKFYSGFKNYTKNELNEYTNLIESEYKLKDESFFHFKELIPKLCSEFVNYNIIVRPHPEENIDFWIKYLSKFDNVKVDNQVSTSSQLLSCDYFIHFNSTMSIQSCYLDKMTIMYNPIKDVNLNNAISPITQDVSIICDNINDLFHHIKKPNHKKMSQKKNKINLYIKYKNEINKELSSILILNELEKIEISSTNSKDNLYSFLSIYSYLVFHLKFFILFLLGQLSFIAPFLKKKYERFKWRYVLGKKKWDKTSNKNLIDYFQSLINDKEFLNQLIVKKHFGGFFILKLKK